MPRGKYVNHKGRSRHFTSPEELANTKDESSEEETTSSDGEDDGEAAGTSKAARAKPKPRVKKTSVSGGGGGGESSDENSDEESSEEEDRDARKGVAALIEIENPNRATKRATQKLNNLKIDAPSKPELTRREREEIEKQKAAERYQKLHAAGKTTEAKADLARLALVRQQRAEAAAKREAEKKALEKKSSGKA